MNNYFKKIMAVIAICFFAGQLVQAQEAKFGIRVGGVISRQEYKSESILIEPESKFGLDLALTSDFPLGEVVSFGPELHWMQKGFKAEDFDIVDENGTITIGEATATLNYLELPLLVKFNFGGEDVKMFVMAGPSVGYLLSGKYEFDGVEQDEDYDFVNRLDVGAQLGAGVHLGPVVVDVRYMLGLSNYAKDNPAVEDIKNTGFGLGVGIMF